MTRNPLIRPKQKSYAIPLPNQSAGILDDFPTRRNVATHDGTIEHTPSKPNDIVNKNYVDSVAANPEIDLFFTQDASDIGSYFNLDVDLNVTTKTTNVTSVPGGSTGELLMACATQLNEEEVDAIEFLETGIYDAHIHATGAINNTLRIFFEIYQREAGGTENLLATSIPSSLLKTSEEVYNVHASVTSEVIWTAGDRIVIKWFGTNTGGSARNITLHMEGNTTSRIDLPAFLPLSNIVRSDGMTDNRLIRGDTASHSIQESGIIIDDTDNMTGVTTLVVDGAGDSSFVGNVGIGTTSPLEELHLNSTGDTRIRFTDANSASHFDVGFIGAGNRAIIVNTGAGPIEFQTNGAEAMRIDSSGQVGIGTSSPAEKLDISGTDADIRMTTAGSDNSAIFLRRAQGTIATPTAVVDGLALGKIAWNGHDGTSYLEVARINIDVDGVVGTNDLPTRMEFSTTTDGDAGASIKMLLDNAGNLGIGTASIRNGGTGVTLDIRNNLYIGTDGVTHASINSDDSIYFNMDADDNNTTHNFIFSHNGTGTSGSELMRIQEDGKVGIGTASPDTKLHVEGTLKIGGDNSFLVFGTDGGTDRRALEGNTAGTLLTFGEGYTIAWFRNSGGVGIGTASPNESLTVEAGVLSIKETTTPTATTNYGKIYTKTDNKLYFQDGAGTEHEIAVV